MRHSEPNHERQGAFGRRHSDAADPDRVPPEGRLRQLLAILDEADTLRLVETYGGTRIVVPSIRHRRDAGSRLQRALSPEACKKIMDRFGGETFKVPVAKLFRAQCYWRQGMATAEIARKLVMDEATIHRRLGPPSLRPARRPPAPAASVPR